MPRVNRAIELLSQGPARAFGLPGGAPREGEPADLTVLATERPWTVEPAALSATGSSFPLVWRHKPSPCSGRTR